MNEAKHSVAVSWAVPWVCGHSTRTIAFRVGPLGALGQVLDLNLVTGPGPEPARSVGPSLVGPFIRFVGFRCDVWSSLWVLWCSGISSRLVWTSWTRCRVCGIDHLSGLRHGPLAHGMDQWSGLVT